MTVGFCPRCGEKTFEILRTHSFCINCSYYPEIEMIPPFSIIRICPLEEEN